MLTETDDAHIYTYIYIYTYIHIYVCVSVFGHPKQADKGGEIDSPRRDLSCGPILIEIRFLFNHLLPKIHLWYLFQQQQTATTTAATASAIAVATEKRQHCNSNSKNNTTASNGRRRRRRRRRRLWHRKQRQHLQRTLIFPFWEQCVFKQLSILSYSTGGYSAAPQPATKETVILGGPKRYTHIHIQRDTHKHRTGCTRMYRSDGIAPMKLE